MLTETFQMSIEAIGTDDGRNTYEIHRKLGGKGKKSLVIELYPTITADKCGRMDLSTMHLLNHAEELGWSEIRNVNLYSKVFAVKPTAGQLEEDTENISYIETILEEEDIREYDLIIAWGNTLLSHKNTINAKIDLLSMMKEKGLASQVRYIVTDSLDACGVHPLYLGLRYANDKWKLRKYPLEKVLQELENGGVSTESSNGISGKEENNKTESGNAGSSKVEKDKTGRGMMKDGKSNMLKNADKSKKGEKKNVSENYE